MKRHCDRAPLNLVIFIMAYVNRPLVMFSVAGLATKIAQLLLEGCLLYLIVAVWRTAHQQVG